MKTKMKDHRLWFYGLLFLSFGEFHWSTGVIRLWKNGGGVFTSDRVIKEKKWLHGRNDKIKNDIMKNKKFLQAVLLSGNRFFLIHDLQRIMEAISLLWFYLSTYNIYTIIDTIHWNMIVKDLLSFHLGFLLWLKFRNIDFLRTNHFSRKYFIQKMIFHACIFFWKWYDSNVS